jgi:uncharacterized phiE125 gp8 family phage protein
MPRNREPDVSSQPFTDVGCAWVRTVEPTLWPISLAEAKAQARITDDASNSLVQSYIQTATAAAEEYMGRGILTQTWKLTLDAFANLVPLPMAAPLQSVTSVKYYDTDGVQQTLSTSYYDTDLLTRPGRVVLKSGQSWPATQSERRNGRVEIIYIVGQTAVSSVPDLIKQGIRVYVTYLDLDRDGMEDGAQRAKQAAEACWSDRVYWTPPSWC